MKKLVKSAFLNFLLIQCSNLVISFETANSLNFSGNLVSNSLFVFSCLFIFSLIPSLIISFLFAFYFNNDRI